MQKPVTFGESIKILRETHKISQEALSAKLHISRSTLANYECGKRLPNIEIMKELCQLFQISADYFIWNIDAEESEYHKQLFVKVSMLNRKDIEGFLRVAETFRERQH